MFSHFFIDRPIFAGVIAIVIMLLGGFAMVSLPVERYPDISPPSITVEATYPGADANTVADTVAAVIEKEVNGVEGMIYMNSVSANDGTMNLTVTFETGVDLDMANVLTQNRVAKAIPQLPQEVQRLGVKTQKKSTDANLYIGFYSPDGDYDDIFLANFVALRVKDEVARVPGVGEVFAFGAGDYSMRIWLDPELMKSLDVTADDVVNAVREQNLQVAAGQIGEPPVPKGQAYQMTMNVKGRLLEAEEFEDIVIRTGEDGRLLRIKDVAKVELGAKTYVMGSSLNGKDSNTLAVYQIPGENALNVVKGVREKMTELEPNFPDGLEYKIIFDNTDVIVASINEVKETLVITLILVILTVYVFLQNFRATIIPSVTIPVSLIGTFAAMSALGYSINTFTLFGLVLVIGIVVDDAIVVVENCTRLIDEEGLDPKAAAKRAMTEISGPVIATTLVLLSVFIPTTFMPGITGQLFKQFAVTISVATVFSTINALTLSPALCGILLRPSKQGAKKGLFGLFNRSLDTTKKGYLKVVTQALRKSFIGLLLFIGLAVVAFMGFGNLPGGFVPQEDEGYCMINVTLPEASSLERTREFIEKVNAVIGETPGLRDYMTIAGYSILDGAAIPNAGFSVMVFEQWDKRGKGEHQADIIMSLNQRLSQLKEGLAFAFPVPSLPGVGMSGGLVMQLQDRGGAGMTTLQKVADEFMNDGNSQSGLEGMYTTFRANVPQLFVDIDRDQVLSKDVSMSAVFNALQYFYGSVYLNDFTYMNRVFQVKAQAAPDFRREADQIRDMPIRSRNGNMLPLGAVLDIHEILGPQSVTRYNMYPAAKIMGQPAAGYSTGQAMELIEDMGKTKLPASMGVEWTELSYQEKAAQGSSNIIYLLAIILVYLVLAAQYESWSIPVSVCLSVPTALLGAVIALMVGKMDNNVYAQVGIVLLIGLCTKTAILIVEFAKVEHDEGKSVFDAAMSAANLRFRAVLMTAFSFILGVIPLLLASGAGAESRKVLGATVFGGMLVATVASLIFVPMLYFIVQNLSEKSTSKKQVKEVPKCED
ncbi:efflux RND transporter permease subunit [Pontiella sulfatireligans]|uniref:Efflux pump membrane transporter BepG n=1 Tax=Pontiella sulfatireligans TaxID=2750658 RepID=A0A6C2UPY7_9BACT|nr:multidrug efflux RND transporter permease subunit [Pontiella sulfatireligans]VGO21341.1 Efflux pump membrane transporter BepG [Pontiella sulfatireligans]